MEVQCREYDGRLMVFKLAFNKVKACEMFDDLFC